MRKFLPYGVSAAAMLAALSMAQAQSPERGEKAAPSESKRAESPAQQGVTGHQAPQANRNEGRSTSQKGESVHERSAQKEQGMNGQEPKRGETAQKPGERASTQDRSAESGRGAGQNENRAQGESQRNAKATPGSDKARSEPAERQQNNRQRASNAGGAARSGNAGVKEKEGSSAGRVSMHITAPQRTELHQSVVNDHAIHVYHRGDIHFTAEVGERIPDTIEFFAPPPRFVEIDPEFRRYRIVVLDTEILVIDPDTREIVDIIPT